ncbi:MAG: hypothetical protein NTY51_04745 [Deltaproteobacteria bacterium]|nr:hypothetical protein [Deltaproteobacteria bacterium]
MKKLLVVIALTVSIGLLAGLCAEQASAFSFKGLPFFGGGAKSCAVPVCAPVYCGYYCAPAVVCKPVKAKSKAKAKATDAAKEKKVKKEKKDKK